MRFKRVCMVQVVTLGHVYLHFSFLFRNKIVLYKYNTPTAVDQLCTLTMTSILMDVGAPSGPCHGAEVASTITIPTSLYTSIS